MIPWIEWTTYSIGPVTLQVWGTFVALGILLASFAIYKNSEKFGLKGEQMMDLVIWLLVGGFIGARLGHVFLYEPVFYFSQPLEILKIWHGGLSSFGGFVGAGISFFWFAKRNKIDKKLWLKVGDLLMFGALPGWMVARVGCFLIHDHPGTLSHSIVALQHPNGARLDMALLEIFGILPLALYVFVTRKKLQPNGLHLSIIFIYYGTLRFILDFWRATDVVNADARYFSLTPGQYFAIVMVAVGVLIFRKKVK
jgi:phosphatidylglycerol---prolipoprotein diacylglyceryl transferase